MYEDYFDFPEPSTGDIVFEELKKILLGTIKEEIKTELERLRAENEELRPYREERDRMQQELARTQQRCERRIQEAERRAKTMALEEVFSECIVDAWKVDRKYTQGPKCDKCDEKRNLHFISPRGKAMTEACECAESTKTYVPTQAIMTRFKIHPKIPVGNQNDSKACSKPVYRWYTTEHDIKRDGAEFIVDSDYERGIHRLADREDTPFEKLNEWSDVFTSKERCQAFCDYLNEKEVAKNAQKNF